jgi:hypothetical protein
MAALATAGAMAAQDAAPEVPQSDLSTQAPPESDVSSSVDIHGSNHLLPFSITRAVSFDAPYTPLTLAQKYEFSLLKMTGAGAWPTLALHAALDQAGALPRQWGGGMDSFGVRMASSFGRSFVRQNITFMVRAVDHEDPRYFRLGHGSHWNRSKWAVEQTFRTRNDHGGWMPAYSRMVANYTVPLAASQWGPGEVPPLLGARNGTIAFGFAAISNVFQEFWPDLKSDLQRHFKEGGRLNRLLSR